MADATEKMDEPGPLNLKTTVGPLFWGVAPDYELVDVPEHVGKTIMGGRESDTHIVPRGEFQMRRHTILPGGRVSVETVVTNPWTILPLTDGPGPFLDLANTVRTRPVRRKDAHEEAARDAAQAFARKWGLLSSFSEDGSLKAFLSAARRLRRTLKAAEANDWRLPPDAQYTLRGLRLDSDGVLQANSLLQFCWLELLLAIKHGTEFYKCQNPECGKYGLQREPGRTGPDRKFCSDACRKKVERARPA